MNSQLKSILNPKLYNVFLELAKNDVVLQSVINKTKSPEEFVNALLAAIICITDREASFQELLKHLLESNPQVKDIITLQKDFNKKDDPSMLPQKENS